MRSRGSRSRPLPRAAEPANAAAGEPAATDAGYVHIGISAKTVDLENAILTGGENGIQGVNARIAGSTITGNSENGISATRLRIAGSDVTGNTLDLHLGRRPKIEATTCDTSNGWHVCADD